MKKILDDKPKSRLIHNIIAKRITAQCSGTANGDNGGDPLGMV